MAQDRSLEGKLVVLIGGSGFVGTHVAQELLNRGARLRIASRHPEKGFKIKPLGNLGQVQCVGCDVTKPDTIRKAMTGADAAVYLVGAFNGDLQALQADGAGIAAEAAKSEGAESFVLVSAIGADTESEAGYARTKALGEQAVLAAFPNASVLRAPVLFGKDDNFINMFARLIATLPVLPVFGADAQLQPLMVDDAAEAVAVALSDPATHGGKTFEIAGPEVITMGDLHRRIASAQGRSPALMEVPDVFSAIFAALPGTPMNSDQWHLLKAGSVPSGKLPGLKALGITPRPLGLYLDRWMVAYRKHGRFTETTGSAG
jgi:NADH dehydrogenase